MRCAGLALVTLVTATSVNATEFSPGSAGTIRSETWACTAEARKWLDGFNDQDQFRAAILTAEQQGTCRRMRPGTRFTVVEVSLWKGATQINDPSSPGVWWVTSAVLDENASRRAESASVHSAPFRAGEKGTTVREALLCDWEAFRIVTSFTAAADRNRYVRVAELEKRCKKAAPGAGLQVLETSWWYGAVKVQEVDGLNVWWIATEALTEATAAR